MSEEKILDLQGPTDEVGMWLYQHPHEWQWVGSRLSEHLGWFHPVFRCALCADVIEDTNVRLPPGDHCPEKECIGRAGHPMEQHFDGMNRKWS